MVKKSFLYSYQVLFICLYKINFFFLLGIDGKLNGDNLDFCVDINDVRMNNKVKDYYFFVLDWVVDRVLVKLEDLNDRFLVGDSNQLLYMNFILILVENI